MGLSDVAAVRIHEMKVFPVKSERNRSIDDVIAQVQSMMVGSQPLWMRRAISRRTGEELAEQTAY
jgi:nitrogen fixation protein NifX